MARKFKRRSTIALAALLLLVIEYGPVTDSIDTVFFETYVKPSTALRAPKNRTYQLLVNERLAKKRPSDKAVRAILVHELLHIRDYAGMNVWELLKLKKNTEDSAFRREYERQTDERTLKLGYGSGLITYREWLYNIIENDQDLAAKRETYMTPAEIRTWMAKNPQ